MKTDKKTLEEQIRETEKILKINNLKEYCDYLKDKADKYDEIISCKNSKELHDLLPKGASHDIYTTDIATALNSAVYTVYDDVRRLKVFAFDSKNEITQFIKYREDKNEEHYKRYYKNIKHLIRDVDDHIVFLSFISIIQIGLILIIIIFK